MSPNPADRPTAYEVLDSDLLPTRLQDEQLKHLLRSLPDPHTYDKVLRAVFAASGARHGAGGRAPRTPLVQQQVGWVRAHVHASDCRGTNVYACICMIEHASGCEDAWLLEMSC